MSTLKEVDITPCPQAAEKKPCELKRGTEETIEVKFTPSKNCLLFFSRFSEDRVYQKCFANRYVLACTSHALGESTGRARETREAWLSRASSTHSFKAIKTIFLLMSPTTLRLPRFKIVLKFK